MKKPPKRTRPPSRGINCPDCQTPTITLYSRPQGRVTFRRRQCPKCGGRFTTKEIPCNRGVESSTDRTQTGFSIHPLPPIRPGSTRQTCRTCYPRVSTRGPDHARPGTRAVTVDPAKAGQVIGDFCERYGLPRRESFTPAELCELLGKMGYDCTPGTLGEFVRKGYVRDPGDCGTRPPAYPA